MSKLVLLAIGIMLSTAGTTQAVDITNCGAVIPAGQVGELLANLTCPGVVGSCYYDPAVSCSVDADCPTPTCHPGNCPIAECSLDGIALGAKATLHMNGHTINGGIAGVGCKFKCEIVGPGTIVNMIGPGVITGDDRAIVSDLDIHDSAGGVVSFTLGRLQLTNVSIDNVSGIGVRAGILRATNVSVTDSGAADGGFGIYAHKQVKGSNVTVTGNSYGLYSNGPVRLSGLLATGNTREGLTARNAMLTNSTLSGNDTAGTGVDVRSKTRPKLKNSTCVHSGHSPDTGESWGVCSGD